MQAGYLLTYSGNFLLLYGLRFLDLGQWWTEVALANPNASVAVQVAIACYTNEGGLAEISLPTINLDGRIALFLQDALDPDCPVKSLKRD